MRVRFGIFDFDPASRELRREGIPLRLQAQPAQVLAALVEHAGQVVTREQLRQAIWGSDTFVDFDRGLNYCIAQIRSALGDSADAPRFVRTIPKQGYQFVAPLGAAEAAPTPVPSARRPDRKYFWAAALALAAVAILALFVVRRNPATNIAVVRFDNETGIAGLDRFADGLTDAVTAELTAADGGRHGIIGNASILRGPRNQRDLNAIGSALKARYVILGQVQSNSTHIRVLAHLIRLPEQTHIWVVRFDRDVVDPLQVQEELGKRIADEFAHRLGSSPLRAMN